MNPAIEDLAANLATLSSHLTTATVATELGAVLRQALCVATSRGIHGNALAALADAIAELETPTTMMIEEAEDDYEGSAP